MPLSDLEKRAIRFLASEWEADRREFDSIRLAEALGLDEEECKRLKMRLEHFGIVETLTHDVGGFRMTSRRIDPSVIDACRDLDAPRDRVRSVLDWMRSHRLVSFVVLGFIAASFLVSFANALFLLRRNVLE